MRYSCCSFYGNHGIPPINKKPSAGEGRLLLGYPDSNQERQDQNLQCYHYTIAQ